VFYSVCCSVAVCCIHIVLFPIEVTLTYCSVLQRVALVCCINIVLFPTDSDFDVLQCVACDAVCVAVRVAVCVAACVALTSCSFRLTVTLTY